MDQAIVSTVVTAISQPGAKVGVVVGLLAYPLIKWAVSPVLSYATKYALSGTAKITPLVAAGTKAACLWVFKFPIIQAIISSNPKACETLVDTLGSCASAIILTVQQTVDDQIEAKGLEKAPSPAPATPTLAPTPA
jgi:hypothetical protein